jgi:hypothetical protein
MALTAVAAVLEAAMHSVRPGFIATIPALITNPKRASAIVRVAAPNVMAGNLVTTGEQIVQGED